MNRPWQRLVRWGAILPPLLAFALYGYWRFLGSDAFRVLLERALSRALAAEVRIGAHRIELPTVITLGGFSAEFLTRSQRSGVSFRAEKAEARASGFWGIGPVEEIVLSDVELDLGETSAALARLDLFARGGRGASVERVVLERAGLSFSSGGRQYRVSGTDWTLDFSDGKLRLSAGLKALRVEGLSSSELDAESPEIGFDLEIAGEKVVLKRLEVSGRSGWRVAGELEVDLGRSPPVVRGELELWDLRVSRIYTPPAGVEITQGAHARRIIRFSGPADDLGVAVTTEVRGLDYADRPLGLEARDVKLDVSGRGRLDALDALRSLAREPAP